MLGGHVAPQVPGGHVASQVAGGSVASKVTSGSIAAQVAGGSATLKVTGGNIASQATGSSSGTRARRALSRKWVRLESDAITTISRLLIKCKIYYSYVRLTAIVWMTEQ